MTDLIAGGYAAAGATGLYRLRMRPDRIVVDGTVAPLCNVSAGVFGRARGLWYLVDETANEIVAVDPAAGWRERARVGSGGHAPCHLALDAAETMLAVANYGDGVTASFRLDERGIPVTPPVCHSHAGCGPVADRQAGPHAHWVGFAPDGTLYVTDLGSDRILAVAAGSGPPRIAGVTPPGAGPRQIAFHPHLPILYLVSELASTLSVLQPGADGTLVARRTVSTLPPDADADSLAGALLLDARTGRLYVTNRGHDSVAAFAIEADGDIRLLGHRASGGVSPRFLLIAGDRLLVAHEERGGVTALPLDTDGMPGVVTLRADLPGAAFLGVTS